MDKINLTSDDVVSMDEDMSFSAGDMFKVIQLERCIKRHLEEPMNKWVRENGIECEVLQASGGGWRKGKMRLRLQLEFIADKPPEPPTAPVSPLDDLRSHLNNM